MRRYAMACLLYTSRIDVRGVDEIESGGHGRIQYREGHGLVGGPPEHVAAEAQGRHLQTGTAKVTQRQDDLRIRVAEMAIVSDIAAAVMLPGRPAAAPSTGRAG